MEPDRLAELSAAVLAQEAARRTVDRQIQLLVTAAVRSFSEWYSSAAITAWTRSLVRQVEPVQRNLARATDAYLAALGKASTGRTVRPVGAIDVQTLRDGISHAGAYGRVADAYRYQAYLLKQPETKAKDLISADQAAMNRAMAVALTDAMLVPRAQTQKFNAADRRITGYRRIIHPEDSASGTCGLCVAAAERLYGPTELMPIHPPSCNCEALPVYDGKDPGFGINEEGLTLYADAGGATSAAALKRTRYKVVQHSELGPLLVRADGEFRTAADIAQDERS